jgi:hypothetical protein
METSPLRLGALATFGTLGFAGVVGLIAVFDADSVSGGFGRGLGIAVLVFLAGATLVCSFACIARGRAQLVSLGSIVVAGLTVDLLVLAICFEIENEAYGKTAGIAFVWSLFALIGLGLTLAVGSLGRLTRVLYGGALGATILAALISTWLIATAGASEIGSLSSLYLGAGETSDNELFRVLGAALVVLAALWFSTLAASRLEAAET